MLGRPKLVGSEAGTIGHVRRATLNGPNCEQHDITDSDSLNNCREFEAGLVDGGTVDVELFYNSAYTETLRQAVNARTLQHWYIQRSDNSRRWFWGRIQTNTEELSDQPASQSISIKVTGKVTSSSSSSSTSSSSSSSSASA